MERTARRGAWRRGWAWSWALLLCVLALLGPVRAAATGTAAPPAGAAAAAVASPTHAKDEALLLQQWRAQFEREVDHRLEVPPADQQRYIGLLQQALAAPAGGDEAALRAAPQALVLVDRSPQVQAAAIVVRTSAGAWFWLGAAAVSTGKPGSYDHFYSPLGVHAHTLANPDFRSLGTRNKNGIRGYGARGRRVFDLGWKTAERGWGAGGRSLMRLQMHATDPQRLEARLGTVASEGCIRIPATLNVFLDTHGVLDADYEAALARGDALWVIRGQRTLLPWPGRYVVIVDTQATVRPAWSPLPRPSAAVTAAAAMATKAATAAPLTSGATLAPVPAPARP